ncbi:hypothetical protein CPB84DRAFT_1817929 [Gymnopilus junonius]|uniref:Uncharacterized protein n=1 Tax=Gymnopilus junonius TaxID=109634 RepID=A0A9P5N8A8_GYMJU|nr:hypothetical protein CPB84DRAFT_1817929 [Gymnopilus junonius]
MAIHNIHTLKLKVLNNARKLVGKAKAIDEYKQWVMAIGSGHVERVDHLVRVNLAHRAAVGIYKPRNYTEVDHLRGLLMWRLGGAQLAGIGQHALHLPSLTTLRRNMPTLEEVTQNVKNVFAPIMSLLTKDKKIVHQVLMFDELKVEEHPQYDEKMNKILGFCHEHTTPSSLEYASENEIKLLLDGVQKQEVHLAVDHVTLIQTAFDASHQSGLCTISIASDGESRCRQALVLFTFKKQLSQDSPIWDQLSSLEMMNLEVSDDDVTADKDYKHIFKRLCNLLLRETGILVYRVHMKPAGVRSHLHTNNVSLQRSSYLLNPEDRQDVYLAYDLLQEIWRLLNAPTDARPGFRDHCCALQVLGELFCNLILPYICVDLSLSDQLVHLSSAAHLLMALWSDEKATTKLMPTQLYVDIMIAVKNVYFSVAKAKVDDPDGEFWIILLGTDRLEMMFGILRTMVGNDANLDLRQLGERLTGTTKVSTILAKYPHWDRAPH